MKISDINVSAEVATSDTLLTIDIEGNASRIPFGNLIEAVWTSDSFRNGLVEALVGSDYFQTTAKATVIATLETLGELPENSTAAFLDFLQKSQTAGDEVPDVAGVLAEQTVTVGPNVTLAVED
jgi:hypothetical protein